MLKTFSFAQNQVKSNLELQARCIPLELSFGCYCQENSQREVTLGQVCSNVGKIDMQLTLFYLGSGKTLLPEGGGPLCPPPGFLALGPPNAQK